MIAKEKIEKIVHNLNGLLEKPTIAESNKVYKDYKGYVWEDVYNAIGGALATELSCKLLACIIGNMTQGGYVINCVESLGDSLRKMVNVLDKELEVRKVEFDIEESVGDMDFESF